VENRLQNPRFERYCLLGRLLIHELKTKHDELLDIMAQLVEKTVDSENIEYQIAIGQLQGATASIKAALANIQATAQAIDAIAKAAQAAANVAKMAAGA
jgi:hypothetical protein